MGNSERKHDCLQESNDFKTAIVSKQELDSEKISTTAIREALTEGNLRKQTELEFIFIELKEQLFKERNEAEL